MSIGKKFFKRWVLAPVLLVLLALFLPWKPWIEQQLIAAIEEKNISPVSLTLNHIGLNGAVLRDISLGTPPLKLARATVGYDLHALLSGELHAVRIQGLTLHVTQDELGWNVEGLPAATHAKESSKKSALPVSAEALRRLPFRQFEVQESSLNIAAKQIEARIKLDAMLQHGTTNILRLDGRELHLTLPGATIMVGHMNTQLTLDDAAQQWQGNWSLKDMTIASESLTIPPLMASGTLTVFADALQFTGSVASDDATYKAQFSGELSLVDAARSHLKLLHAHVPWSGGEIALNKVKIPLSDDAPIMLSLEVKNVAIDTLMQALTGNKATASGVVSGVIPLRISKAGQVTVGTTSLKAQGPGIISLSPEVIPGDNAQIASVRDLLKNLHYTLLSLDVATAADNTLSATLWVEGTNPDVAETRPVKLKVHLSGDLLDFVVQNQQLLSDPHSFIEQKHDE